MEKSIKDKRTYKKIDDKFDLSFYKDLQGKEYDYESEIVNVAYRVYFTDYYQLTNQGGSILIFSFEELQSCIKNRKNLFDKSYPYLKVFKVYVPQGAKIVETYESWVFNNPNYDGKGWIHQTKEDSYIRNVGKTFQNLHQ